jgi:hypothetical protein
VLWLKVSFSLALRSIDRTAMLCLDEGHCHLVSWSAEEAALVITFRPRQHLGLFYSFTFLSSLADGFGDIYR